MSFCSGSFDSELSGQRLLDKAYVTSAELHAFASTQKRPPESQDACTNTEAGMWSHREIPVPEITRFNFTNVISAFVYSEPSRSITDKAVFVQLPSSPSMPSARKFMR